ncbi:MAG: hypothetical protein ACXAEL_15195 [Candidatus Hodarchaeales archaeon]|jgi:predicted regulator of Ras-like GTPase activity (Roadblock/LC7/MglB family)
MSDASSILQALIADGTTHDSSFHEIQDGLENLFAFEGVAAVLLLRIDGLVIQSLWPGEITDDLLPLAHWIRQVIAKVSEELQEHTPHVRYDRPPYTVSFFKVGQAGILCGVFYEGANPMLLNIEMSRAAAAFGATLHDEVNE